ncbi:MAG TPA: hypothetical protein H9830_03280 [Candidatus Agrococcus pullicola]|uniref:Putative Flp pilus-assembly TadG-like N-terminal domain-containing protein n=1 Tax=Candidatus Agrococcus pullicola TaxID=2838429 RepID=A0A9D2C9F2_9MICO|nr:hypothetical protein [Candidatus Agrococcus pullicola]
MKRLRRAVHGDDGSSLILTIGMGLLALLLILVVTAATSMLIERKRLFTIADGAALVAAESFSLEYVYDGDGTPQPQLTQPEMERSVEAWLETLGESDGVRIVDVRSEDGETASVMLETRWQPFFITWIAPDGIAIRVTATARSVFGQ